MAVTGLSTVGATVGVEAVSSRLGVGAEADSGEETLTKAVLLRFVDAKAAHSLMDCAACMAIISRWVGGANRRIH